MSGKKKSIISKNTRNFSGRVADDVECATEYHPVEVIYLQEVLDDENDSNCACRFNFGAGRSSSGLLCV
jgi:hypothetical protein